MSFVNVRGRHSGAVVSTVAPHQEGPGFESGTDGVCTSPCVCVGSLWVLRLPLTSQKHSEWGWLIGDSKLPVGVNVSVDGSLNR